MENNQYSYINRRFYASIFCALFSTLLFAFEGDIVSHLNFKKLPALNNLPTDEIQKVYQDKDGFIWLASRYGFYQYDGYEATLYKSNLYAPGLLTNNNILCLVDDYKHNLWIGTQEGLNILNKKQGRSEKFWLLKFLIMSYLVCWLLGIILYGWERIPGCANILPKKIHL